MIRNYLDAVQMSVLTEEKIKRIHNGSLRILEEVGVIVHDKEALDLLDSVGAHIGDNDLVKIPHNVVEQALLSAPKKITLYNRDGQSAMILEDGNIYFGSNIDTLRYLDPYSKRVRKLTREDAACLARIGDYLPNISFLYSVGLLSDYDARLGSIIAFSAALKATNKVINFSTNDARSCADIIDLATAVKGSKEKLKREPFIFHYCQPIPPLKHGGDSCQKLLMCAEAGVPVVYMPYSMMGGTAPASPAAALAQSNAEILSGLVLHQSKSKGAPFIIGNMPTTMDMRTTIGTYGTPEFHLLVAAASELAAYYKIPFYGTAGCADSKNLDYQAVTEVTMNCFTSLLSRAHLVHDIGFLDHSEVLSPELIVLINEIIDMGSVIRGGIQVDTESLAFDVIKDIGPGGHYLEHEHTYVHFKNMWCSPFMDRSFHQNAPTLNEKINGKTKEILETHESPPLDDDIIKMIEEMEQDWIDKNQSFI